jgi:uncharacterized protein (DUF3084 family)
MKELRTMTNFVLKQEQKLNLKVEEITKNFKELNEQTQRCQMLHEKIQSENKKQQELLSQIQQFTKEPLLRK